MKILFVGSTDGSACALHYYNALVREGHTVLPFNPRYFETDSLIHRIEIKLRKGPTAARVQFVSDELIKLCEKNQFDLVFVMAENFLHGSTIQEMKEISGHPPAFLYHSHDNNFSEGICKPKDFFKTLAAYDVVFTTKSQNVLRYRELGQKNAHFIPSAFEPSVHYPIPADQSRYAKQGLEVTFVGTYDRSREPIVNTLDWNHLRVWGSQWQRFSAYTQHKDRINNGPIYYFEFADVLSHSACSLGLLRAEAEDLHTQRTFEIPACGSLQFSPRTEEILSFFEEDKEIVCFGSPEELKDKLNYYLANSALRQKLALAGHERCLRDKHTYHDRITKMLDEVGKLTA